MKGHFYPLIIMLFLSIWSCEDDPEHIRRPTPPLPTSIYDLSGLNTSDGILCFQDRFTFKRVYQELQEKYDEDSLYFNFNDTTISEDSVPYFPTLDIFETDMNHLSLRSLIELELHAIGSDPSRDMISDYPDNSHVQDPFFQSLLNEYFEFKIGDTVFKSLNECTMIMVIDEDELAKELRPSNLSPSTTELNHPEIKIENTAWDCGDCRISYYRNIQSIEDDGYTAQFIPYKLDSTVDTVLTGYELSWRFNDTLKSDDKYPTVFLPFDMEININVITKSANCYYETGGAYKRGNCDPINADFEFDFGTLAPSSYQVNVEDNGSVASFAGYPILIWEYDFGDQVIQSSGDPNHYLSHVYTTHGEFTIKLKMTDSKGCISETEKKVEIGQIKDCCKKDGFGQEFDAYGNSNERLFVGTGWVGEYLVFQTLGSKVAYFDGYRFGNLYSDHYPKRADFLETGLCGTIYSQACQNSTTYCPSLEDKKNRKCVVYSHTNWYFPAGDFVQKNQLSGTWGGKDPVQNSRTGSYYINPICIW